jgi:hypothetical protein
MDTLKIEILNPKALQLIKGMQDLKLIKVHDEQASSLKKYLEKMRQKAETAPDLDEITSVGEEVRSKRYANKKLGR